MRRQRAHRMRREGMTLIEIMIVVVIMAMIAGAAGFAVMGAKKTADLDLAKSTARNLGSMAEAYLLTHGSSECPTVEALAAGGILKRGTDPNDPWGHPYRIECDDTDINVRSAGPDGELESDDDIALF